MNHVTKKETPILFTWKNPIDVEEYALCEAVPSKLQVFTIASNMINHSENILFKTSETFKHLRTLLEYVRVESMDVSLEARRRCSTRRRGAASLWSSNSWNRALRWGRRVRTASALAERQGGPGEQGNLGKIWWLIYVDVSMYDYFDWLEYVRGTIPILAPSCLYAELVLILIRQNDKQTWPIGVVFANDGWCFCWRQEWWAWCDAR